MKCSLEGPSGTPETSRSALEGPSGNPKQAKK